MTGFYIRDVQTPGEVQAVAALAKRIWTKHYTPIIGAEQVAYMLAHFQSETAITKQLAEGYHYSLACAGQPTAQSRSESVGYCATRYDGCEHRLFVSKLYVADGHRNKGVATALLQHHMEALGEHGTTTLWLTVNKTNRSAIAAYRRMGFAITDDWVTDIGEGYVMDDYKMEKVITDNPIE